jgi:hypothetical protein
MAKATTYRDEDYDLYPKDGGGRQFKNAQGEDHGKKYREITGLVATPFCFVSVTSYYHARSLNMSRLEIVKDGRSYDRRFNKAFTQRGLVTKAKQFAAELHRE